jgi:6-phosphogluconolactonase
VPERDAVPEGDAVTETGAVSDAPGVLVHADPARLAEAAAARLATRLAAAQSDRGRASVVLTGGGVGTAVLRELSAAPARDALDWRSLDVWWGDERFLPPGDPDRNETAAQRALLDHVPVDPARVHPMPGPDGAGGGDPEAAAAAYAGTLRRAAARDGDGDGDERVPAFDVLLLGLGPDTHIASLFPGMPGMREGRRTVAAVRGAPKPPPTRLTLTLPAIRAAREVWIVAAGAEKARAVRLAASADAPFPVPGSGARGRERTLFLVDRAAAGQLPADIGHAVP